MDQYLNDDEQTPLEDVPPGSFFDAGAGAAEVPMQVNLQPDPMPTQQQIPHNDPRQGLPPGEVPSLVGQAASQPGVPQAGADQGWIEEEFSEDFEEGDGSWLMSLDDDRGGRAGFDEISGEELEDEFFGTGTLEASWQEEQQPKSLAQRALVPLAALAVVALVGAAGWRMLGMRSFEMAGPEVLRPQFDLGAGRIIKPTTTGDDQPRNRVEVIGKRNAVVDPDSPNAARPNALVRGSLAFVNLANPNSERPNFVPRDEVDRKRRTDRAQALAASRELPGRSDPGTATEALPEALPEALGTGSELVAVGPEFVPEPQPTEALDSGPTLGPTIHPPVIIESPRPIRVASADTPTSEVSGRWRRLLGLESEESRARRLLAEEILRAQATGVDDGSLASATDYVRDGAAGEIINGLPYGLDAAFLPDWRPPTTGQESPQKSEVPIALVRSATWSDMTNVWPNPEIPLSSIEELQRLRTPAVGFVAVTLDSGEVLDGQLHSVGQGRVWVETKLGRTALESWRIKQIVAIDAIEAEDGVNVVDSLDRVRVRSAGGVLFGHVLSQDDSQTTIVTDGGSRITVPNEQVDFVGTSSQVLLKRG